MYFGLMVSQFFQIVAMQNFINVIANAKFAWVANVGNFDFVFVNL